MPVTVTCPDHPEVGHMYPGDIVIHASTAHPGEPLTVVDNKMVVEFQSQAECLGVVPRRIFRCRYCAAHVETTDPDRPTYCDLHLGRADG